MKVWKALALLALCLVYIPQVLAAGESPVGKWTTIDEKTGNKRAEVELVLTGDTLSGTIVKIYKKPTDTGICSKCPGEFKNKKILGLRILWGLKDQGNGIWSGGFILDPKKGKIYRVKIALQGRRLLVRAFVGTSMLGRTQTWLR